jgi:hypothetical protein
VALDFGARAQDFLKRITPLSADLAAGCDEYPAVRPVAISLLGNCGGGRHLQYRAELSRGFGVSSSFCSGGEVDGVAFLNSGAIRVFWKKPLSNASYDKFLEGEKQRKSFDDRSPSAKLIDATDGQDYLVRGAVKGIELCVRLWQGIRSTDCRG